MDKEGDFVDCQNCGLRFDWVKEPETKMGYVDCPKCGYWVDQTGKTFLKQK